MPKPATVHKVLVANRGEIAVRVIRAAGMPVSAASPSTPTRTGTHCMSGWRTRHSPSAVDAGRDIPRHRQVARRRRRGPAPTPCTPATGSSSENADFAQAVIDAGLTWIGPPSAGDPRPRRQGHRAAHRAEGRRAAGAPARRTRSSGADEVVAFAEEHGLPVAIKAAFGGGGRGLKVARTLEEIPELFESAVREAVAAFGRGECFVERYLDKPRHVEAQVPGRHSTATSSWSEPATARCSAATRSSWRRRRRRSSPTSSASSSTRRPRRSAGRPATSAPARCEYLVGEDGTISFLEVNTRLQVEHPVSEETTGIDLVREQFRIADGEELGLRATRHRAGTPSSSASTARTPGRGFLPAPGTRHPLRRRRRAPACGWTPASRPAASSAARSTRCSPS